jgi:hypothetical protein
MDAGDFPRYAFPEKDARGVTRAYPAVIALVDVTKQMALISLVSSTRQTFCEPTYHNAREPCLGLTAIITGRERSIVSRQKGSR